MKKVIYSIIFNLLVAFVAFQFSPTVFAEVSTIDIDGVNIISETDEKVVYQITNENGELLEYHEDIVETSSETDIMTKVYLINADGSKTIYETFDTNIESNDSLEKIILSQTNLQTGTTLYSSVNYSSLQTRGIVIDDPNPPVEYSVQPTESITLSNTSTDGYSTLGKTVREKGGSFLLNSVRWYLYSDGTATAWMSPVKQKTVSATNSKYITYRQYADKVRSYETSLVT
ncbi:hypothetical protein LCL95_17885 [Bacillus timonensis]|nr:hypothetical protein [Bacillus timonensis]